MTHLSLFSGIGGLDLAAEWAGFKTVQFVERDEFCQKVLAKNFPGVPIHGDITTFSGHGLRGRVDVVSGGFPCQPHSLAGKRLASRDERDLSDELIRVLVETGAPWFVGENVPGLLTSERGQFFGGFIDRLAEVGFRVAWGMWGAKDVGACHRRNRVFIVAYSEITKRNVTGETRSGRNGATRVLPAADPDNGRKRELLQQVQESRSSEQTNVGSNGEAWFIPSNSTDLLCDGGDDQPGCKVSKPRDSSRSRDWRTWGIEPVICRSDDDVSRRVDVARLKALGNAVVPEQAYPIFKAIAEVMV